MRELKTRDLGKGSQILKKMGVKLSGTTEEEVGMSLLLSMAENYHHAEEEIAELMADLIGDGMTKDKFLDLELDDSMKYFKEFAGLKSVGPFFNMLKLAST